MTTVAWDGQTLAVDKMATFNTSKFKTKKLFDCGEFMFAGCGDLAHVHEIAHWLLDPEYEPDIKEAESTGIVIHKDSGKAYMVTTKPVRLMPMLSKRFAVGSGSMAALGVMEAGGTAVDAIKIASKVDIYTGLGVDSWTNS